MARGRGFVFSVFLVLALIVLPDSGRAAECDTQNPFQYKEICYPTLSAAEAVMRSITDSSGAEAGQDWRVYFTLKQQVGNRRVYHLPPQPLLPDPAWRTSMVRKWANWGWRGFASPYFATYQEAEVWLAQYAGTPSHQWPNYYPAFYSLVYRGAWSNGSANYRHYSDAEYDGLPMVYGPSENQWQSCDDFPPGVTSSRVGRSSHSIYDLSTAGAPNLLYNNAPTSCDVSGTTFLIYRFPTFQISEVSAGPCQSPYGSNGTQCVSSLEETIYEGGTYSVAPTAAPTTCPPDNESNPCNPADGAKTQVEVDFTSPADGGVEFVRYYSSKGAYRTFAGFPTGWRHTYARRLDEEPDRSPGISFAPPAGQSNSYFTVAEACTSGWTDIKDTVWSGDLATATAIFVGGNTCKISQGGSTVAYFPVRSATGFSSFTPPPDIKTVSRPDGSVVTFEYDGSMWVNYLNPALKLEQSGSNWIYTDASDTKETFSTSGRLLTITTRSGQVTTLLYNSVGAVVKATGPFGHTVNIKYHFPSRELRNASMAGSSYGRIDFNVTDGRLTSTTRVSTTGERFYLYERNDLPNHLTGIIDKNGDRFATWDYDTSGRAILSEYAGGKERVEFAYNADDTTTLTLGNGATRTYHYTTEQGQRKLAMLTGDVCSTCPGGSIADKVFDTNGFIDEVQDWNGNITQTVRNAQGLTETLIEAKGTAQERTTTTVWHSAWRLPTQIVSPKNTTDFTYDANGNIETVTTTDGVDSRGWAFTYNAYGQPLTIDGPRTDVSDVTTITYYECSTGWSCYQISSITNALGHATTNYIYDGSGRLTQMEDANGLLTHFAYNFQGLLKRVTLEPVVGADRVTNIGYDAAGQLEVVITPDGRTLTYTYDAAHYLRTVTDNLGNRIDYDYDAMGNPQDEDSYDSGSGLKRAVDYVYDLNNRLDSISSGGFVTDFTLDLVGNLTNAVDPNMASTQHEYDALNRLEQTIDALTGVIEYEYDDHDNLTSVLAANGATTTYVYDDLDNLTQETSADRGTLSYTYDEAGNRLTKLDARGKLTSYSYDALNRLTLVSLNGGGTIAYEYDVGANAIGRLSKITDATGETSWSYDFFGAVTQKTQTIGPVALTSAYSYDAGGKLATMTLPSGKVVSYGYNTYQQDSITVDGTTILSAASYDPFGPVTGWTWGNSSTHSRAYDLRGLMTSHTIGTETRTLGHDAVGQLTSLSDSRHDDTFDYDLLGRVEDFTHTGSAPLPATQMFAYDANGNRTLLTENSTPYSYSNQANSNRLLSTAGPTARIYTHDAAGNVLSDGSHSYGYDDRGRLVSVDSGSWRYQHNGQGQRVKKRKRKLVPFPYYPYEVASDEATSQSTGAATQNTTQYQLLEAQQIKSRTTWIDTLFAYDEAGQLIGEYNAQGTPIQETVWFNGAPVSVLKGTDAHYVHTDQLGTPRAITDGDTILWRWESDAFGLTGAQEDVDGDGVKFAYNLRFAGQYFDQETGLHYNYFRTYDPSTGRYLESDPIGLDGGLNTYGYVGSNPLRNVDPFGLDTLVISNGQTYTHGGGNPFGHTAIATTGSGVYSNGNNTNPGSSVADYLKRELGRRDTTLTIIKTTPEQEKAIIEYLKSLSNKPLTNEFPDFLDDNCAVRSSDALATAGLPLVRWNPRGGGARTNSAILPLAVQEQAEFWKDRLGGRSIAVPMNSELWSVLRAIQQFEPK